MTDQQNYNGQLIEEFRANRHKAGGPFEGRALLLGTTRGAKSTKPCTTPMMYIPDGEHLLVIPPTLAHQLILIGMAIWWHTHKSR